MRRTRCDAARVHCQFGFATNCSCDGLMDSGRGSLARATGWGSSGYPLPKYSFAQRSGRNGSRPLPVERVAHLLRQSESGALSCAFSYAACRILRSAHPDMPLLLASGRRARVFSCLARDRAAQLASERKSNLRPGRARSTRQPLPTYLRLPRIRKKIVKTRSEAILCAARTRRDWTRCDGERSGRPRRL